MRSYLYLLIALVFTLQGNAQLKKFNVEIPQPAKFTITDSIQSFTILNRSITNEYKNYNRDSLQVQFYQKNFEGNDIMLDSMVSDTIIQALGELLFESDRYDIVIPTRRNIPREESFTKTPKPLDWSYVKYICDTYNTDALIVLENAAARVVTNYDSGEDWINGMRTKTHYASMDFYSRAHWRVYEPKNENIVVDFIMNQDTIFWDSFEYDIIECFKKLPAIQDANIETGIKIALDFSQIIAPSWVEDTRYYYVTKNPSIDKSIQYAADGNWAEALDNWLQYANSGKSANRSKVMLNVALAYEMNGDLENAIIWAKKSLRVYYREVTNHFLKELLKREAKLNKQG